MAEETTTETETTETSDKGATEDQRVPYERFREANQKAKEAAERATKFERDLAELRSQLEAREQEGLPELDRLKRSVEAAEKRAQEAENRAQEQERNATRLQRRQLISAAAREANFHDPDDAAQFVDLDEIEDGTAAERAVKRLAKQKAHLVKSEETPLPGRVLENGRTAVAAPAGQSDAIDGNAEAEYIANQLGQFLQNRWQNT